MNHQTYSIVDVPPIESLDDPAWSWAYHGAERVSREVIIARFGNDDLANHAEDFMVEHWSGPHALTSLMVAVGDGSHSVESVLGWAEARLSLDANLDKAHLEVEVLPDMEGSDVGDALLVAVEQFCWVHGRTALGFEAGFGSRESQGNRLPAPSGGSIPADAWAVRLAVRHGYVLTQAKRQSILSLPVAPTTLEALWSQVDSAHEGYRLHVWDEYVPQQWRRGVADVIQRFTTLAPYGPVSMEQEVWDEDRVERVDRNRHEMGRAQLRVAVEDVSSGQLVGYTGIIYHHDSPESAEQGLTLVFPDHRRHRLGLWMKLAALEEMQRMLPTVRRIYTINAEENTPMLTINLALGFVPFGGSGAMQKVG